MMGSDIHAFLGSLRHIFLVAGLTLVIVSCGSSKPAVPINKAVAYQVLSVADISFPGRKRLNVSLIAPAALTGEERAQTALKAAVDVQQQEGADEVSANLEISQPLSGHGFALAIADYAPDGGGLSGSQPFGNGTWEAQVTDYVVSPEEAKIADLWYENESKFQINDGFGGKKTNEKALKKYIAKLIDVQPSAISVLPLMAIITTRHDYNDKAISTN